MGNIFPPSFQETDINCSCVKGVNVIQQSHQVHCRLPQPGSHAQGDGRLQTMAVGTAKLSQECWIPSSGFAGDKVSQHSPPRPLFPLKLDFHKSLMDDGPCLASSLSLLGSLWVGNKGLSSYSISCSLDDEKKSCSGLQGGRWYISGGTATTKRKNFSSSFFLKKVSGVHYTAFFLLFPYNGEVNARQIKMRTSITEHLEQQQQTR